MSPSTRTLVALLGLAAAILAGCGSGRTDGTSEEIDPSVRKAYVRALKAAAPAEDSRTTRMLNQATAAGEYRRAAVALEEFLPEVRAYVRRLEEIDPPPACARFQRQLERVQRASIRLFTGALPLYRNGDDELVRTFMLRADRILEPIIAPIAALDGADRLPCLAGGTPDDR